MVTASDLASKPQIREGGLRQGTYIFMFLGLHIATICIVTKCKNIYVVPAIEVDKASIFSQTIIQRITFWAF